MLEFKQSDWMKKHIDFNTEKRMNAANDFELIMIMILFMEKQWKICEKESMCD